MFTHQEMENSSEAGTMRDLDAPIYGGEVWLVFGIDKGGKSTKVVLEIAGKPHLIGMFKAADSHQNLEAFFREGGGSCSHDAQQAVVVLGVAPAHRGQ